MKQKLMLLGVSNDDINDKTKELLHHIYQIDFILAATILKNGKVKIQMHKSM